MAVLNCAFPLPEEFFLRPPVEIARRMLGCLLVRDVPAGRLVGRIVETEAYLPDDPACHGVRELPDGSVIHKRTRRNATMFGPPGRAYVYFTYGCHYMMNIIVQPEGVPAAVLLRALEPLEGFEEMAWRRGTENPLAFTNGPGKLARAFGIDRTLDGHDVSRSPLRLLAGDQIPDDQVVAAPRIGISRAVDRPWRFYVRDNPWVSRTV